MSWIYALVFAAAMAGVVYGVESYNSAIKRATVAEANSIMLSTTLKAEQKSKADLQALYDESDKLVKLNQQEAKRERDAKIRANKELDDRKKRDPAVAAWADTAVPEFVRGLRRASTTDSDGGSASLPSTNVPLGTDTRPGAEGQNK